MKAELKANVQVKLKIKPKAKLQANQIKGYAIGLADG